MREISFRGKLYMNKKIIKTIELLERALDIADCSDEFMTGFKFADVLYRTTTLIDEALTLLKTPRFCTLKICATEAGHPGTDY